MRRILAVLTLLAMGSPGFAELRLAAVFSDGMVLQRDQSVAVWGWADSGTEVVVSFAGGEATATADRDGKFIVRLNKMKASAEPGILSVAAGDDRVEVKNVLVGEVWLCSGQSNMAMTVQRARNFPEEKAAAVYPSIRMFSPARITSRIPQSECTGSWTACSPDTVGGFSATGYFFARELHRQLDVPVGLLHSSWGGTCIEAWSPMASLEPFPSVMEYKADLDLEAAAFDASATEAQHAKRLAKWQEKADQAKANGTKPPTRPKKPTDPHTSQNYPANLYNAMIHPLVPYGMRGAIWYQGERNGHSVGDAILYRDLLENLVVQWRKDWDDDFPFYAVQLVNFRKTSEQPVQDTPWPFIRESFLRFHQEVANVGIAVGIDVGEEKDIHPKNKQAIGYRLAQQALAKTYGMDVVAGGPIYQSMTKEGHKIVVSFDDVGTGLIAQDGLPLQTFAIAGAEKSFVEAEAEIVGDTVVVHSPKVSDPIAVRYAWADNPVGCNLFNKDGFPASPFRTDDWPPSISAVAKELIQGDVLSRFAPANGWSVVGSVVAVEGEQKFTATPHPLGPGGILSNGTEKNRAAFLFTKDEFSDVKVSLEFTVPKESNAGVYLMGRYEIQIFDSFGVDSPTYSDLGGVYQRWDDTKAGKARGYEGQGPLVNAAKAPGEWQNLDIVFRAPRFDVQGRKTENARFLSVHVNGQLVQKNVEVTGPTRAHPLGGEAATGPIAIQGDHGPIAIRSYTVKPLAL